MTNVLTQLVAVGEKDGSAVKNMRQRSLNQLPARDALDGFSEGWRESVEFVLHQHPLERLARINSARHNPQEHFINDYLFLLQYYLYTRKRRE